MAQASGGNKLPRRGAADAVDLRPWVGRAPPDRPQSDAKGLTSQRWPRGDRGGGCAPSYIAAASARRWSRERYAWWLTCDAARVEIWRGARRLRAGMGQRRRHAQPASPIKRLTPNRSGGRGGRRFTRRLLKKRPLPASIRRRGPPQGRAGDL